MVEISVVSPVYLAEGIIKNLVEKLEEVLSNNFKQYEIILVEDGSPDNSWGEIMQICERNKNVKGIRLSRNFGQHYAVTAGVHASVGEVVVLMDCDLQDDPKHIIKLHKKYLEGFEIVFTKRIKRKHSLSKKMLSWIFKILFHVLSDKRYSIDTGSMVLFGDKARRVFLELKEKDRLYIQLLKWMGFKQSYVEVEHKERLLGKSSYSFLKQLNLAIQGWISFSDKVLRFSIYLGLLMAIGSFLGIVLLVLLYFFIDFQSGWVSLSSLILFSTGCILTSIGISGIYIGKIFEQIKNRPLYIISEMINFENLKHIN